jgi:hypothetical protein
VAEDLHRYLLQKSWGKSTSPQSIDRSDKEWMKEPGLHAAIVRVGPGCRLRLNATALAERLRPWIIGISIASHPGNYG